MGGKSFRFYSLWDSVRNFTSGDSRVGGANVGVGAARRKYVRPPKTGPRLAESARPFSAYFRRAGARPRGGRHCPWLGSCSAQSEAAAAGLLCLGSGTWVPARRACAMRLGSGTFAAGCVVIQVLGVALFLRGFFPAPVRSFSGTEHHAETPAPEPSAGTDPSQRLLPGSLLSGSSRALLPSWSPAQDPFAYRPRPLFPTTWQP